MDSSELSYWLTLSRVPGLGPRARIALLERFGAIRQIFDADRSTLAAILGNEEFISSGRVDPSVALPALMKEPETAPLEADLEWLSQEHHHLVVWADNDYPPLLRQIPDPPLLLYMHGSREVLSFPQLAMVGSRNPTALGRRNAAAFARSLAKAGLTITSGLALGIDTAGHRGALDADGTTIAVTGTGLDRVYPPQNRDLAHEIVERGGALISEFPIGTPARPGNFPVRNRIISGLSLGVLVIEAAERSGSLITARLAGEQGREVFALPGSIHSPLARGCHALIRQGAKLVETSLHVLEELGPLVQVSGGVSETTSSKSNIELAPLERQLLECIDYEPAHIDVLVDRSGLTADSVSSILLQLELQGLVLTGPGGYQRAP